MMPADDEISLFSHTPYEPAIICFTMPPCFFSPLIFRCRRHFAAALRFLRRLRHFDDHQSLRDICHAMIAFAASTGFDSQIYF